MKFLKSAFAGGLLLVMLTVASSSLLAQAPSRAPIKIGEINSYSNIPQFTLPYRQGWQLAVEEVNLRSEEHTSELQSR